MMTVYHVAPEGWYDDKPNVVQYRPGHPSWGFFVGPDALERAKRYAKEHAYGRALVVYEIKPVHLELG